MTLDQRGDSLDGLRGVLSAVLYPVRLTVDASVNGLTGLTSSLSSRARLLSENQRLRDEQLLLQAQLQQLATVQVENMRLRNLLDSSIELGERVFVAELLSVDLDPYRHLVEINKGASETLFKGQSVLDATGIMGQVVHVGPLSSTVMLITDPSHAIPIEVNRNGLRSVALGGGDIGRIDLPYLPNSADIEEGDLLITSGLGGRFPRGYPVATVQSVSRNPGRPFAHVVATPSAALERSREVLLVVPAPGEASAQPEIGDTAP